MSASTCSVVGPSILPFGVCHCYSCPKACPSHADSATSNLDYYFPIVTMTLTSGSCNHSLSPSSLFAYGRRVTLDRGGLLCFVGVYRMLDTRFLARRLGFTAIGVMRAAATERSRRVRGEGERERMIYAWKTEASLTIIMYVIRKVGSEECS